jgi:hypothetical protein
MSVPRNEVIVQKWEESEAGWGARPDGYSLHLTEDARKAFVSEYWAGMPKEVQADYSRTDGTPYKAEVDSETFEKVKAGKNGIRCSGNPPGSGGKDGWIAM